MIFYHGVANLYTVLTSLLVAKDEVHPVVEMGGYIL